MNKIDYHYAGLLLPTTIWLLSVPVAAQGQESQSAQETPPHGVKRTFAVEATRSIDLDGRLDEPDWSQARVATDFVQFEPVPGAAPTERTEARVLYNESGLWVGIRAFDDGTFDVVERLGRRDTDVYSDWIWVGIDSYFDRRTAFLFGVNAAGVKRDMRYSNDNSADESWDAVWDVATSVDEGGWTAEFRIPYHQLRFTKEDGATSAAIWGIQFTREIPGKRETVVWSPVQEESGAFVSRFGELHGLDVEGAPGRAEIMPYTVGGLTRAPGDPADPFFDSNDLSSSVGADFKLGLGPAVTLTGTLNPDFGQVEADPSVVNLTAFETFFPEKRPFFVEGSEAFGFIGPALFYSRRIGRSPQARPPSEAVHTDKPDAATILGAAKVSGQTGDDWTIGLLEAVTAREEVRFVDGSDTEGSAAVEPLTNYAVARAQKDFRRGRSTIGGMLTATNRHLGADRLDFLHEAAYAGGVDWQHRFGNDQYRLLGSVSGSHVRGSPRAIARTQQSAGHYFQRPDAEHLTLDLSRTSLTGGEAFARLDKIAGEHWRWNIAGIYTTPTYELNDLGFHFNNDRVVSVSDVRYVDLSPGGPLQSWSAHIRTSGQWTTGWERKDLNFLAEADFELNSGWGFGVWGMRHLGGVQPNTLRGGPSVTNPARWMYLVNAFTDRRKAVNFDASVFWEREDGTDGSVLDIDAEVEIRASDRIGLAFGPSIRFNRDDWQYVTTRSVDGAPHYVLGQLEQTTASLEIRANYTFTPDLSFEFYAQPFISAGRYERFQTVADPLADDFDDRFHVYGSDELSTEIDEDGRAVHTITPAGSSTSLSVAPDFNFRQLRSNAVLRWEYRPGSTLFLVWTQDRTGVGPMGDFVFDRDVGELFDAPGRNVFLIKFSYWLGL